MHYYFCWYYNKVKNAYLEAKRLKLHISDKKVAQNCYLRSFLLAFFVNSMSVLIKSYFFISRLLLLSHYTSVFSVFSTFAFYFLFWISLLLIIKLIHLLLSFYQYKSRKANNILCDYLCNKHTS